MLQISAQDRETLRTWTRATTTEQRLVTRARIILQLADGSTNKQVAKRLELREATVSKWRGRFAKAGPAGLCDEPRSGKPPTYTRETEKRVLGILDTPPPAGYAQWNGSLIAAALGDVSTSQVWRILRVHGISLQRRRSWCVSTDPQFSEKAADVVGLYLHPPDNAVVICVDEKPHIQALERAQGWLKLPDGRALTGFSHEYKRHGTTTLFAALNVLDGQVIGQCQQRHTHLEWLKFLKKIDKETPKDKTLHLIADNYATHKHPAVQEWLAEHPRFNMHFTPTSASWLNMVERFFRDLTTQRLRRGVFTSVPELVGAIDEYVRHHNTNPKPLIWTKSARDILQKVIRANSKISSKQNETLH